MKKVAVIMGSDSDLPVLEGCFKTLKNLNIPYEAHVYSAHRTPFEAAAFAKAALAYAKEKDLTDPYISPLFGSFEGFPPVYIQVGENEMLLSDSLRLQTALVNANVPVKLERFPGMWHIFQMLPFKTAYEAIEKCAEFIFRICC